MKKEGFVVYKGIRYRYIVDNQRQVWFYDTPDTRISIGQIQPIHNSDDVEKIVIQMLESGGY